MKANFLQDAPSPVMPARPQRQLPWWQLLRVGLRNTLEACDEELFDELIVERRFLGYRSFVVSDPEGIRRVHCSASTATARPAPARASTTRCSTGCSPSGAARIGAATRICCGTSPMSATAIPASY